MKKINLNFRLDKAKAIVIGKRVMSLALVIASVSSLLASSIAYGINTGNYNMIGSNKALGSPLLNGNFVSEDWNKWETVTFGIFLSNFPIPLVDTYESALSTGLGGSDGSALKALQFGSGNDAVNNEVLTGLLDYVIDSQRNISKKPIFVQQVTLTNGKATRPSISSNNNFGSSSGDGDAGDADSDSDSGSSSDAGSSSSSSDADDADEDADDADAGADATGDGVALDIAKFNDLFITQDSNSTTSLADPPKTDVILSQISAGTGYEQFAVGNGTLSAFYVENLSGGYECLYDMTDSWDIQMLNAWISRTMTSDYNKEFEANFILARDENPDLLMDCFGNIVCQLNGKTLMLVPAASNSHLTVTPKQNLITSLIFNGSSSSLNKDDVIQYAYSGFGRVDSTTAKRVHGTGAISAGRNSSLKKGDIAVLYDSDTILAETLGSGTHTGNMLLDLFKLDINKKDNKYGFKVQLIGMGLEGFNDQVGGSGAAQIDVWGNMKYKFSADVEKQMMYFTSACDSLSSTLKFNKSAPVLSYILDKNGNKMNVFGETVAVSSMLNPTAINGSVWQGFFGANANSVKISKSLASNFYTPYLYDVLNGKEKAYSNIDRTNEITPETIRGQLKDLATPGAVADWAYFDINNKIGLGNNRINPLYASFVLDTKKLFNEDTLKPNELYKLTHGSADPYGGYIDMAKRFDKADFVSSSATTLAAEQFKRVSIVHTQSNVMRTVNNILGVRDGTEFAMYTPLIYMTYLDWYGITKGDKTAEQHEFNTGIFDETSSLLALDIESISGITTVEDKKKEILNYSYLMLHPTKGREYRNDLIISGMSDWIYRQYQSVVYGNTSDYYSGSSAKLETTSANSFLNINTYADNPWTGWFIKVYPQIMVWMLGIFIIFIVLFGLLKGRQISWFFLSIVIIINAMLIVPSTGELTPYIANNITQNMFSDNMTYWALSESISNAKLEENVIKQSNGLTGKTTGLTESEQSTVASMVKQLNIVYLDRSLMIKQDISKKITESGLAGYDKVQKLQSARWLLPIIMRQFSASDKSANYVYTPLGDAYDNVSNLYWYYNPADSMSTLLVNSATNETPPSGDEGGTSADPNHIPNLPSASSKESIYSDYTDTSFDYKEKSKAEQTMSERGLVDRVEDGYELIYFEAPGWQSNSRDKSDNSLPHTYFYMMPKLGAPIPSIGTYEDGTWDKYVAEATLNASNSSSLKDAFVSAATIIEGTADVYDITKEETVTQDFGYLWSTESILPYMYQVVKDTFPTDNYIGALVAEIQGRYSNSEPLGMETRRNFMRYEDTGRIKDFLDMEEAFTNMVPYLYKVQILTGGMDGKSGLLGDSKIEGIKLYTGNNKSWLFRSNWVTKLMESTTLTKSDTVSDKDGTKYKIINPMLPECYPDERPMMFSEAEMFAYGLDETDMSLPELKIMAVTKAVEQKWTYLLNAASLPGITKEVLYRQMALDATLAFNAEFSASASLSSSHAMYPTSIDLRNLSFDSMMKMMMLNSTKDASYVYGDTMRRVIENSDLFTSIVLLISAVLSAKVIPGLRDVAMAMIFFLGFWSILHSLLSDGKQKLKISFGYIMSNLMMLGMTLAYYAGFSVLVGNSEGSELLSNGATVIALGDPLMICIVIIVLSVAYIAGIWWMVCFCFKNWRDMGSEMIAATLSSVGSAISGGFHGMANSLRGNDSGETSDTSSLKGSGREKDKSLSVDVTGGESTVNVKVKESKATAEAVNQTIHIDTTAASSGDSTDYVTLNREIQKGKAKKDE